MYGGVGPEVRFGQRKDSDWVSLYLRTDNRRVVSYSIKEQIISIHRDFPS